jgi:hypothetical protein
VSEKRKLLNFVCLNSTWKEGRPAVNFRQPFDMIAVTNEAWINEKAAGADSGDLRSIWLPTLDTVRTFCLSPTVETLGICEVLRQLNF